MDISILDQALITALVPVVTLLIEFSKRYLGLQTNMTGAAAIGIGIVIAYATRTPATVEAAVTAVMSGIVSGVAATGLYSQVKMLFTKSV